MVSFRRFGLSPSGTPPKKAGEVLHILSIFFYNFLKTIWESEMRAAYFDCFSGASGDMILGALIDAGLNPRLMREELKKLQLSSVRLRVTKVLKGGIAATRVVVEGKNEKRSHRNLGEVLSIIDRSHLDSAVKEESREVFRKIASVEGEIHRRPREDIHFHELGGLDSVVDIVGAV